MIKTSVKVSLLLLTLAVFLASTAYADGFSNFSLRIDVLDASGNATGIGAVISANGLLNMAPLLNPGIPGIIEWQGSLANPANTSQFDSFNVVAAYSAPNGTNGAELSLSADITRSDNTRGGTIVMTLEDDGYADTVPPTATMNLGVAGLAAYDIFPFEGVTAPTNAVALSGTATGANFQTWVNNVTPDIAAFGNDGVYDGTTSSLSPLTLNIPMQYGLSVGPVANGQTGSNSRSDVAFNPGVPTYSIISQAVVSFGTGSPAGTSEASFGMDTTVNKNQAFTSVPEPTSLLLVGSGLLGLGITRRKKGKV